ncbi:enoyl-CoA hydratase [Priestia filamentosa]|uniref:Enoyl-CoA hydratase n=1 Tax=Priestia filamentosa TaxID=1402861 RepID=A0A1X7E9E9_9BACI|nr:enoyl-CoA hydratase [Priestia filamentosa]AKO92602.1 enoyl-CoA hydratase [Priestia filamentosa]MDT3762681.1 enoyl-CoA hydratase [Priestia filamentosa]OXS69216.1 enoyl-CoA hydratase [Priestia filamentosa]RJS64072.1 enoyl-CoA hydratase [Priestia filamentosa]WCM17746.1 enoyl-CoA hydratase [Priestia filamentosa]
MSTFEFIETSIRDQVGIIELNRPKQYNALNRTMVREIVESMEMLDRNNEVVTILLTGKGRAFSAGADIEEMANDGPIHLELLNQFADWDRLSLIKKPIIGAVQGFVFGGGFELALCCDLLMAASGTEFSFPEVNIGVMPGAGGTQRLTKVVGRAKALEWLWTGDRIPVEEALKYGLVNKIVAHELLMEETFKFAKKLSKQPPLSLRLIKDSVNKAVDYPLYEGMQYERKNFYLLFSSEDQKEGMKAFTEKRKPEFKGK